MTGTPDQPWPHGTQQRYNAGCRCRPCRDAIAAYMAERARLRAYGLWQPYADAGPAREHVRALGRQGIGWQRAAQLAGVSAWTVHRLLYGEHGRPVQRIRPATAAAILAVRFSPDMAAGGALTDATGTRRRLQALVAVGHTRAVLCRRLGIDGAHFSPLLRKASVTAATARAVSALYDELWAAPPDEGTPAAAGFARRARRDAARAGWPLPAAWDDDEIDDPAATPAEGWQRGPKGTSEGLAEDAAELLARGLDRNQVAERLKVKRDTLDAAIARAARRSAAQESASTDTTGERSHAAA